LIFFVTFIGSLIAFFSNLYISTKLGPEMFGNFKTIIYLFTFLPALANLGMQAAIPKYIAEFKVKNREKIGKFVMWFMSWRFVIIIIAGILVFFLSTTISSYLFSSESYSNLVLSGLVILCASYFALFPYIVQGFQNFKLIAVCLFLGYILPPFAAILLIPFGVVYMILGFGIGTLISFLITLQFLLRKKVFSSQPNFFIEKKYKSFIYPMWLLFFVMALPSLAVPLFSLFFAQKVIGYFSFSFMFYSAALLIPNIVSYVILPKTSELIALQKKKAAGDLLKRAFMFYTPIVAVGIIGVLLFSSIALKIVSPDYLPGKIIFESLIIVGLVSGYGLIYSAYLQAVGDVKKTAVAIFSINILLFLVSGLVLYYFNI
jgi:O-antigen/teichoic acid export membrane protein